MFKMPIIRIAKETDKAILVSTDVIWGGMDTIKEIWFPKSQASIVEGEIEGLPETFLVAPEWLFRTKERDHGITLCHRPA